MANQALIKGELGVYTQPTFKGELIAKPLEKAMQGFIQADQKRSAANAKRAGDIEKKALNVQQKGSFAGVTPSVKAAGESAITAGTDVYRSSGEDNDLIAAENRVDNVNHATERFLEQNADYVDLVGEGGEIFDTGTGLVYESNDLDNPGASYPSNVSKGSSHEAMNLNLAIFGGDKDVVTTWNSETQEYDFSAKEGELVSGINSGEKVSQSDLNKNIFTINTKFGTMLTNEANRQGSKDMTGISRYVDYGKNLKTKGQIVSAFYDEMIPGVPSVYDHLRSTKGNWTVGNVGASYNPQEAKDEIKKYYDQILANEQANYIEANPEKDGKKSEKQIESNTFFKNFQANIAAGNASTVWGDNEVQLVEWKRNEKYPKEDKLALLYVKGTNQEIPGYNLATHPFPNAPALYTKGDKTFKFFDPNNQTDIQFLANKLKVNL
jgi:hypothetical protein